MDRREHEQELAASHCRGLAEDAHDRRMAEMREIDEGMAKYVRPILKRKEK